MINEKLVKTRLLELKVETRAIIRDTVFMVDDCVMNHYELRYFLKTDLMYLIN